jgi:hypothetical protein
MRDSKLLLITFFFLRLFWLFFVYSLFTRMCLFCLLFFIKFYYLKKKKKKKLPVKVPPSGRRLAMRFRLIDILGLMIQSPLEASSGIPDTQFWQVGSCMQGLLPKGGFEGPCLGEVHCH